MRKIVFFGALFCILCLSAGWFFFVGTSETHGPSPALTPSDQLKTFHLHDGLEIQLVASEPLVQDPVHIQFDVDGRLWVVEMRGFMPDIDGIGEQEPVGRINILEDLDGDGTMDTSTIYLDSLIMPRALALVKNGALVVENGTLWWTEDLDGDWKADVKTAIDPNYAGSHLPEHAANGLLRAMDNWYYNAKSTFRYRLEGDEWLRDSTEFRGQWGISQDNFGRLIYNYNWSQLHGDLVPPNLLQRNPYHQPTTGIDHGLTVERRIYPIRPNLAINRGYIPGILDEEGKLQEFTAACAPFYYRGTALPEAFNGNAFVCEPSGNLIKRNQVIEEGINLRAIDPNPGTEFLASTDERFRPVNLCSGPDGSLYVADMYRGLVQHGAYISPYLKEITLNRNLVLPVNRGRIWRIVPKGWKDNKPENLSAETSGQLINRLAHADGWHRDMAQRLLVERMDTTIYPQLWQTAQRHRGSWGSLHALWTLQGLHALHPDSLLTFLDEENPYLAATALRLIISEFVNTPDLHAKVWKVIQPLRQTKATVLALQICLSADWFSPVQTQELLLDLVSQHRGEPLFRDAALSSLGNDALGFYLALNAHPDWQTSDQDGEIFVEMIALSILRRGDSNEAQKLTDILPQLLQSGKWTAKPTLAAITLLGRTPSTAPIPLLKTPFWASQKSPLLSPDQSDALHHLFTWPGHRPMPTLTTDDVGLLAEKDLLLFTQGRSHYLSACAGCHGSDGAGVRRMGPPLAASEWVIGDEKQLSLIVLHGMEGPIEVNGVLYDSPEILPSMPAHTRLDDGTLAAILTYIRNEWGNQAGAIDRRFVATARNVTQGRVLPWSAEELRKYLNNEPPPSP
ncbi:MAG: c-type cytochrome [Lunatimonas sp.]|uniref:DUF7133 domain-containing protein n=1 Tax=Lunatimonas sp. TaxID=2060141 RepID=UPI00263B9E7C|nr:c-type cytochrome [Lunatimonas sp.]MCC5938600.1 c-type cytochrome [Lunatimonas sp.]